MASMLEQAVYASPCSDSLASRLSRMTGLSLGAVTLSLSIFFAVPVGAAGLEGCEHHVQYGAPSQSPVLLCRKGYALSHNGDYKVAGWVAYLLTRESVHGTQKRSNDFRADPDLEQDQRSEPRDYRNSGYDKGHLAPAESMASSPQTMSESFLMSNMAPQVGVGFNRHIWAQLEGRVRDWARERGELYVVTGPVYAPAPEKRIGPNQVAVPTHFYKVLFDPQKVEALAFLLPNADLRGDDLTKFLTSIDHIEELTGLDFLSTLEDAVETVLEASVSQMWPTPQKR